MVGERAARDGALLEREGELERIDAALERAGQGAGRLVVVDGPPGIGKTELIAAARRVADERGFAVASARGTELERELPFGVVRQLFEPALARTSAPTRSELLAGPAAVTEALLWAAGDRSQLTADGHDFETLHGLYWLCANLVAAAPLLVAVDDAHWADLSSLRFLTYLAPRIEGLALALVVAARPAEGPGEEELLVRLVSDPAAETLTPAPLSLAAVHAMLAEDLGGHADTPFAVVCHRATGGTPFLVRELIRELRLRGIEPRTGEAARVEELGPGTVARAVVARVRRLGPQALRIARAAAVLGRGADPPPVGRLAGVEDTAELTAMLDALARVGVLAPERPIEFAHPIVRAAVYAEIPSGERAALHAQAAAMLRELGAAEDRVASHLLATDPAGDRDTVELLVAAAGEALARGAPSSAAAYLARAMREPPEPDARAAILHQLGTAEIRAGDPVAAIEHLEEAQRVCGDPDRRARLARDLVSPLLSQGRREDAAQVLDRALQEVGDGDDRDLALGVKGELLLLASHEPSVYADAGTRLGPFAVDVPPSPGARVYLAALAARTAMLLRPAREVHELAERAREAGVVKDMSSGTIGWVNVLYPLVLTDGFDLAEAMIAEGFDELAQRPSRIGTARAHTLRGFLHLRRGDIRGALADSRVGVDVGRESGFQGWWVALGQLVEALVEHGDTAVAHDLLEELGLTGELPDTFMIQWLLAARGLLRLAEDRLEDAISDWEEAARRADGRGQVSPAFVPYRATFATALLRAGERSRALELAERELELTQRVGALRGIGQALRAVGLCTGGQAGIERLRESVETLQRSGARLEYARSLVELGAALRRSRRRADAREPLHAGMETAHLCGAPPLVEQAREELLATGARPRRIVRTGIDALTPSELRVAEMAAGGMTNREIAQSLFVTTRTVESHLTHAFQKLDITSRGELAERLRLGE